MAVKDLGTATLAVLLTFPAVARPGVPPAGAVFTSAGRFQETRPVATGKRPARPALRAMSCPDPGGAASVRIAGLAAGLDPAVFAVAGDQVEASAGVAAVLDPLAVQLADEVPRFLRGPFLLRMAQVPPAKQNEIATVLASLPATHLDEAAFLVAGLSLQDLTSEAFDPWLLEETPADLYRAASPETGLSYATLVEHPDPDNGAQWTTVRLKVTGKDGQEQDVEVPRDVYYWYVVHPKLDLEPVQLTDPATGAAAPHPGGVTWREYSLFTPDGVAPYTDHFLFSHPGPISAAELQGWGPSAATVFTGLTVGPLELVRTGQGLALMEFRIGKGTILATTMPLEWAALQGKSDLLRNCLFYGNGNVQTKLALPHLVVMDRLPDDSDSLLTFLDELKANYKVFTAADFADLDLTPYVKVIVPSDQPTSLYEALAARKDDLEAWIGAGGVFELHAATTLPEDDWSGTRMPGGFTVAPMDGSFASDTVEIGGWPHLSEVLPGSSVGWDGQAYSGLSGDRPLDPGTFALDKVGWFTSQNLFDNVAEYGEKHGGFSVERAIQAVRILYNHYGNCGEIQDVVTAAARTALLPMMNVSNANEDHVWNEFWSPLDGAWRTFQVSWSDSVTILDDAGGAAEKVTGGGKDISMVAGYRGDGLMQNVTARYTETWRLELTVTDHAGRPVDGARVLVASETYYPDANGHYPLMIGLFGYTGTDGVFSADLGDAQNFYLRIESPFGDYPAEPNTVAQVATADEAIPGRVVTLSHALEGTASVPVPDLPEEAPAIDPADPWMRIEAAATGRFLVGTNPLSGDGFNERIGDGTLDVYVLDDAGYAGWRAGGQVQALWGARAVDAEGAVLCGPAPSQGPAHLVFLDPDGLVVGTAVMATVTAVPGHALPDATEPAPDAGNGDSHALPDATEPAPDAWSGDSSPVADEALADSPGPEAAPWPETTPGGGGSGGGCVPGPIGAGPAGLLLAVAALAVLRLRR